MSSGNLGANFSSGHTEKLNEEAVTCSSNTATARVGSCRSIPGTKMYPMAVYPSLLLQSRLNSCPPPTPDELALYPQAAVSSSVLTESKRYQTNACSIALNPTQRFAQYVRYQPPILPPLVKANMAGISMPSVRQCNLYNAIQ